MQNEEQKEASNYFFGPCLVTAVPGSGKTATIVNRIINMVASGINPSSIVCITFTNKAASEMKERVLKVLPEKGRLITISTFHRLCSSILRYHGYHLGYNKHLTIFDDDDQYNLMSQVARQQGFEITKPEILKILKITNDSREHLETDNELFERFVNFKEEYYPISIEYVDRLRKSNSIDFSGLLSETIRLFKEFPTVVESAQRKWLFAMIDETQDTNIAQFEIVKILFAHTNNIYITGDADQSIYAFRGAKIENIVQFSQRYLNTKVIKLGKNYRSTPEIILAAEKLIKNNINRIDVPFETVNPSGPPISCKMFNTEKEESEYVASLIRDNVNSGLWKYNEIAIFYRTNNMSRSIEMAMINNNLPYTLIGGFSFFDRKEIKDCIAMLRFLINPLDGVSFHRFCNKPKRALGDATVGKLEKIAKEKSCSILEALHHLDVKSEGVQKGMKQIHDAFTYEWESKTIAENLSILIDKLKYRDYLLEDDSETAVERQQNIDEFIRDAARYTSENNSISIGTYLEHIALMSSYDKKTEENSVSLQTIHSSKGLEYPVVFIIGSEEGITPHARAVAESEDAIEEERRIYFVAVTRCKKFLNISYCNKRQDTFKAKTGKMFFKNARPSRFLFESGLLENNNVRGNNNT